MSLAAIHLREEPDALRSARPDPCGGQPATAVPTAIDDCPLGQGDCVVANEGGGFNPASFYLGVVELFAILLPGAILTFVAVLVTLPVGGFRWR
jgi:hypothetical protein